MCVVNGQCGIVGKSNLNKVSFCFYLYFMNVNFRIEIVSVNKQQMICVFD